MYCKRCGLKLEKMGFCPDCTKKFFESKKFIIPLSLVISLIAGIILFVFIRLSVNPWDYFFPFTNPDSKFFDLYVNTKKMNIKNNRIYLWIKTIPSMNDEIPYNCKSKDLDYIVIDCKNNSIQHLNDVTYDEQGKVIDNNSEIEDVFMENNIIPDSLGEKISQNVCKNLNPAIRLKNMIIPKKRPSDFADCE